MSGKSNMDGRARAVAFLRAVDDACAERLVPTPGGHAVLDSRHAQLWDANHLRVEASAAPDADALVAAAELHVGVFAFQAINVLDAAVGEALAPALLARAYAAYPHLLMLLGATPPAPDPAIAVVEVARARLADSRRASMFEDGHGNAEVGRQMVSRDALVGTTVAERCFAVLDGDAVAARTQLYAVGDVAQVENVYTAPTHRSRGYAQALVAHAAREARAGGAEVVFLVADAEDWPRQLYSRLGFADAGLLPRFRKAV